MHAKQAMMRLTGDDQNALNGLRRHRQYDRKGRLDLIEAMKILDRPKVGRAVHRENRAETIAQKCVPLAQSLANASFIANLTR